MLNTILYLNNSHSKYFTIGLQEGEEIGNYEVVAALGGSQDTISLTLDEWKTLQNSFTEIHDFFEEEKTVRWRAPIVVTEKINITFTTSFKSKTVMIEKIYPEQVIEHTDDGEPSKKKGRQYIPSVIFKKVTFDNLLAITGLIDLKISCLENLKSSVTACKKSLSLYAKGEIANVKTQVMDDLKDTDEKIVTSGILFDEIFNELFYTM